MLKEAKIEYEQFGSLVPWNIPASISAKTHQNLLIIIIKYNDSHYWLQYCYWHVAFLVAFKWPASLYSSSVVVIPVAVAVTVAVAGFNLIELNSIKWIPGWNMAIFTGYLYRMANESFVVPSSFWLYTNLSNAKNKELRFDLERKEKKR